MKFLIIGGNAAGMSAASKLSRMLPGAAVTVLEQSSDISYGNCGFPYYFGGLVDDLDGLYARRLPRFREMGIEVMLNHAARSIERNKKQVIACGPKGETVFGYDRLILATGASPFVPPVPGMALENVFTLRTMQDARDIDSSLDGAKKICVVGGGYIGLEMAENFSMRGLDVTVVQRSNLLPALDESLSVQVQEQLVSQGVEIKTGHQMLAAEGGTKVEKIVTDKGSFPVDLVLVATGIRPNSELASQAGLEISAEGTIVVDDFLVTSDKDIFAAGDCARNWHRVSKQWSWLPLGDTANKMGKAAAVNAAGDKQPFPGVVGTAAVKVFELNVAHTGFSLSQATGIFPEAKAIEITAPDRPGYYPGGGKVTCRLVFLPSGRLVGAQAVGSPAAVEAVNICSLALSMEASVEELAAMDLAYAPPYSPVWHLLLIAAGKALKETKN